MSDRIYYSQDAEEQAQRERNIVIATVFTLGIGFGALAALLMAPKKWKALRREIGSIIEDGYESGKDTVDSTIREAKKRVS